MAKDKKAKVEFEYPVGMKCYTKVGGGSHRFKNRIIKPGQNFWCYPDAIAESIKDRFKEIAPDKKAVIVSVSATRKETLTEKTIVPEKFKMVEAFDENGEKLMKGENPLYNVIGEDEKPLNDKPLRENKAVELLESLNS